MKILSLIPIFLLLLFIRTHHAERQDAFVDEAYHLTRAAVVWDFAQHPGRFGHGKLLLYFWLGFFESAPQQALFMGRLGVALFSLVNGAAVYGVGRLLHSHRAGALALALYAVLPFAFFFERMALADSFAAGWAGLVAWRSLIFARRPSHREGALLGGLLALATLAKLTMGLLPLLPVVACLLATTKNYRRFLPPLITAAGVMTLFWLPVLVPAGLAMRTDTPFVLVDANNLQQLDESEPAQKFSQLVPLLLPYFSLPLAVGWGVAVGVVWRKQRQTALFLLAWLLLLLLLPVVAATLVRTRYLMPLALPLVLLLSIGVWELGKLRWAVWGGLAAWLAFFALPFATTSMNNPSALRLADDDWVRYMSGNFSGAALRQSADYLATLENSTVYATWGTCQLLYLYNQAGVYCLEAENPQGDLARLLEAVEEPVYVVLNGDAPFALAAWKWTPTARFARPHIERPVTVWRLERPPTR